MMSHDDLLARLLHLKEAGRVRNAQLSQWLGLPSARVTEILKGARRISLDEAATLVTRLKLDPPNRMSEQAARLFVLHAAKALGVDPSADQVRDLAEDLQGFAEFATSPAVRDQGDKAQQFFLGRSPSRKPPEIAR